MGRQKFQRTPAAKLQIFPISCESLPKRLRYAWTSFRYFPRGKEHAYSRYRLRLRGVGVEMTAFFVNLHYLNMFLVLAISTITGIWGQVLYFQKKEVINQPWKIALIVTAADGLLQGLLGI